MQKSGIVLLGAALVFLVQACATRHAVEVAPVEVKPIHITIDVNVRIDKALDDFFDEIDAAEEELGDTPSTEP